MDDASFTAQATTKICGSLDPKLVLSNCFDYLRNFIPMESISMTVFDDKTLSLSNIAYYFNYDQTNRRQVPPEYWQKSIKFPRAVRNHIMSHAAERCNIVNDAKKDLAGKVLCKISGIDDFSYIVLKVPLENDLLGQIVIGARGLNLYSHEHSRLVERLQAPFVIAMTNAIQYQEVVRQKDLLSEDNRYLYSKLRQNTDDTIIGKDRGLKDVMEMALQVSRLKSLVMLRGETGVGKEVIANTIHYNSSQANGPFIKINCGAIPDNLIDSELFGHEKGAFTGAVSNKRGHFERAQNGTLFLDEIGDLPQSAQVRLLRVLQQKELIRVGGSQPIKVNARIIVATHHNLEQMVQQGEFREDLWFRINVFPIIIPPLRQRREDIPDLVLYFINRKSREMNLRHRPRISSPDMKRLLSYHWPGNVRELENCVERALIRQAAGDKDGALDFEEIGDPKTGSWIKRTQQETESDVLISCDEVIQRHIQKVLRYTKGKIYGEDGAAAILKLNPSTLRHRMRKLGISSGKKRKNSVMKEC